MRVATLQWPKTSVPLVWSYNSSLGAVLQKAALKKLYKEASQICICKIMEGLEQRRDEFMFKFYISIC